jgi:hypothetical protein
LLLWITLVAVFLLVAALAVLRASLGEVVFALAWEYGRTMTTEQAIACALDANPPDALESQKSQS